MNLFETEDFLKLLLSMLLGGLVGAEREYRSKSAGLRTTILISVGSTLFTMVSQQFSAGDRIAANIVNGIGFLGAGIIYRQDNNVRGLTTAATIWAVAALGMSIGRGLYSIAWGGFGVMMTTLLLLPALTDRINRFNQTRQYRITTRFQNKTLSDYENVFKVCGLRAHRQVQQRIGEEIVGTWKVVGSEKAHEACIQRLLNDNEVKVFEF